MARVPTCGLAKTPPCRHIGHTRGRCNGGSASDEASTRRSIVINSIDKVLYTAHTRTTGGRDGYGKSSDGALDVKLSPPGSGKPGTNPEQLFAVGWSACFIGAMGKAAAR